MTKKLYAVCIMIIASTIVTIVLVFMADNKGAVNDPSAVVEKIEGILPPELQGTKESRYYSEMPMMNIDGCDYAGILEVPSRNIKLPVYSHWDESYAMSVPCRYSGSIYSFDLVIGVKNDNNIFGFLTMLNVGDEICFKDMTGKFFCFEVSSICHKSDFDPDKSEDDELLLFSYLSDVSKYIFIICK